MKKSAIFTTALLATYTLLLTGCDTAKKNTADSSTNTENNTVPTTGSSGEIPIGVALAQTSNVALLGQEGFVGTKMAAKYFNDQGGINGTPIKLVSQDTGGDEAGAINAFQTLINKDKVVGIVGPTLSQQAFSADPIADRAKVPVIGPSNTAKGIPEIGDYVARVSAGIDTVAPNSIKAALKQNPQIKKVAVFYAQNDAFNKSETEVFQKTAKEMGLSVVTVQKFQTSDTDFQSQVTNALNLKPDLAIVSGLAVDGGNLVKQLRELGYKGVIVGGNGFNTPNIFSICKASCDGILVAQAYSPEYLGAINKIFHKAYVDQYKKEPAQLSAQSFTAVQVYVEALRALDKKTKISTIPLDKLRTELNKQLLTGKYETPLGEISFTATGDVIQKEFYVAQIKMDPNGTNGKFTFIK